MSKSDMKIHELKTRISEFRAVFLLKKTFEIRKNDRDFKVGDGLLLKEYDHIKKEYTGTNLIREITHILPSDNPFFNLKDFVILSIKPINTYKTKLL